MTTTLPSPAPAITEETRPYWEAAAAGQLTLPRCGSCSTVIWYPRGFCPECQATDVEWFEASGRGVVYSYTISRRGRAHNPAFAEAPEVVLAYVELAEGPRVMTNVVDCAEADLRCGLPVHVVFHPTDDGKGALVRFAPDPAE
ncbi:Zn-ribbon domain-containing OB-fold protein [Nocardia miyunensis]|uniref:Zn-ribbon domain-containing OB-fold protein n=1 Tax=Nocardia miyunensis TaxID=282684 RepID=UPI00082AD725|nr:Zn-ribbon domain-containing OB-fold protein [Nocardia miyunensis]